MSKRLILRSSNKARLSAKVKENKRKEMSESENENEDGSITSKYFETKGERKRNSVKRQSDGGTIDKTMNKELNNEMNEAITDPRKNETTFDKSKGKYTIVATARSENQSSNTEAIINETKGTSGSNNEINRTETIGNNEPVAENSKFETVMTVDRNDKWMPKNWEIMLENIRKMRLSETAPVDSMGCHKCSDPNAEPRTSRYQSLIALMLSSQTKDQVTHAAMQRLNAYGCTPEIIVNTPDDVLEQLIYPVGFRKKKVQYIKKASKILIEEYESDIPRTLEDLCKLPGVGPKMGHICMRIAWNEVSGIGVDTHVHRICNRIGWVRKKTKTPEETRADLEEWLPKHLWCDVNHLLVGFGQEICLPRFPKCDSCLNKDICPSSTVIKSKKPRESREKHIVESGEEKSR